MTFAKGSRLERIGVDCFSKSGLEEITIPSSVTFVESNAFSGCESLRAVIFSEENAPEKTRVAEPSKQAEKRIKKGAFSSCRNLKRVVLGNGQKVLGDVFQGSGLEEITLPKTMEKIDGMNYCSSLRYIYVEDGCIMCFSETRIAYVEIGPLPETMAGRTRVWDLRNVKNIVIPDGVTKIGNHWFYGTEVKSVKLSASVKEIGDEAFCRCAKLSSVKFTGNSALEKIGKRSFY